MDGKTVLIGGVVVVAAFGFLVSQNKSGSQETALEGQVATLTDRISDLETALAEVTERADAQAAAIAEGATLGSRLAETVQGLGAMGDAAGQDAAAPAAETAAAAAEPEAAPAAASDAGTLLAIGQTAVFGDGSVRVFLSRVDAEADAARIAVNGIATTTLAVGESVEAGDGCTVTLGGIEGNQASLGYTCGS
ncbi:hypothetical protein [Rhodovulum euryhalinum]|uniref:Uncharacterized protein n=1 Tax=Rhodovulum euryhalinum TaxID=35805 RepID=A0A4R2KUA1_9RHOB|nr:hypothetical protein [Rhodovulum euryhalinum]TCO70295.1 hypothetical protein EV655_11060 [Rhodovulum euryhalinum]